MLNVYNGKNQIKAVWAKVKNVIEMNLPDFHEEDIIIEDVYSLLVGGRHDLWVAEDDATVDGFFITQIFESVSGETSIHILYMGGVVDNFYANVDKEFKEYLNRAGIKKIQFSSNRSGMERFCNKFNYKESYVVYEGTLDGVTTT